MVLDAHFGGLAVVITGAKRVAPPLVRQAP